MFMEETSNAIGKFLDPDAVIAQLEVESGSFVADFGCGPGYFSLPFARIIGEEGHLYALDVLPQALERVSGQAKLDGLNNISTERVNLEKSHGSHLEDGTLDWVIMKDILFQNQDKKTILAEAYRVLKNGGRVIFVEWGGNDSGIGPQKDVRIGEKELKDMIVDAGFELEKEIDAGFFHYAFIGLKV
jgi:ubiquinone/menaquinone biosynthesis C-methylase UbiE